jgi:hypothetical protein
MGGWDSLLIGMAMGLVFGAILFRGNGVKPHSPAEMARRNRPHLTYTPAVGSAGQYYLDSLARGVPVRLPLRFNWEALFRAMVMEAGGEVDDEQEQA